MIAEETNSPVFRAFWGSPPSLTFTKNVPKIDVTIPIAPRIRGRTIGDKPPRKSVKEVAPATIAAPRTIVPIIDPT